MKVSLSLDELFATQRYLNFPDSLIRDLLKDKAQLSRTLNAGQWEKTHIYRKPLPSDYFKSNINLVPPLQFKKKLFETDEMEKLVCDSGKVNIIEGNTKKKTPKKSAERNVPLTPIERKIISEIDSSGLDKEDIFARIKSSILNKPAEFLNDSDRMSLNEFSGLQSFATTSTPIKSDKFLSCNLESESSNSPTKQVGSDSSKQSSTELNSSALKENVSTKTSLKRKNVRIKINVRKENIKPELIQKPLKMKGVKRNFIQENILNASTVRSPKRRMTTTKPNTSSDDPEKQAKYEANKTYIGSNPSAVFFKYPEGEGDGPLNSVRSFQTCETTSGSPKLWITLSPNRNK